MVRASLAEYDGIGDKNNPHSYTKMKGGEANDGNFQKSNLFSIMVAIYIYIFSKIPVKNGVFFIPWSLFIFFFLKIPVKIGKL